MQVPRSGPIIHADLTIAKNNVPVDNDFIVRFHTSWVRSERSEWGANELYVDRKVLCIVMFRPAKIQNTLSSAHATDEAD